WLQKGVAPTAMRLPDHPPSTTPPAATEDQAPPPAPSAARLETQDHPRPARAMMTRGELLNTISTELFHQVRARGDAGRQQRMALLEACFGKPTMGEVTTLADDVLEAGLHHMRAKGEDRPTTTQGRRERE